jgi:hypothetical protein
VEGPDPDDGARRRVLTAAIAVGALVAIVAVALLAGGGGGGESDFPEGSVPPRKVGDLDSAARAAGCALSDPRSEGEQESGEPVEYRSDPPHSGAHAPEPPEDGAYRSDPPPAEAVVHSLYHGRIVIWFGPDLDDGSIGDLKALFDESPEHVILMPRESMEPAVAATAWTHKLACPEMSPAVFDAIRAFRDTWRDQGPEFVP